MKVSEALEQLARDLNDAELGHEFTTWTREQVRGYLLEGLQVACSTRPGLFAETVELKVTPCVTLQDLCDCDTILSVLGQSDGHGRVIKQLRRRSGRDDLQWPGISCPVPPSKNFRFDEYSIDPDSGKLRLYPPAPPGLDLYVLVECSIRPDSLGDDEEIKDAAVVPAMQWALYRAKMVDAETNPAVLTAARLHESSCFDILVAQRKYQKEKGSDGGST